MLWLINLIAERVITTIGIPPTFVDRGDPASADWTQATLTADATWRTLDLSGIIDEGASVVLLRTEIKATVINKNFELRNPDNSNWPNVSRIKSDIANQENKQDLIVIPNSNREIEYYLSVATWSKINLTVAGWWM